MRFKIFTISSLRRELSPTRTLNWPRAQSCANHVHNIERLSRATCRVPLYRTVKPLAFIPDRFVCLVVMCPPRERQTWGQYHGGRRPSSDDSLHSPTVIQPSAVDKPSIMKRYHRRANGEVRCDCTFADDGNAS